MKFAPNSKPQLTVKQLQDLVGPFRIQQPVYLVGVRGYYEAGGQNRRGIYDDAIMLVGPNHFSTYNANTDPSITKPGTAMLATGQWLYRIGIHGLNSAPSARYKALVQAGPVTVIRDEQGPQTGWFGINIHRGGWKSTSSLGCQTIFPEQWIGFLASVEDQMYRVGQHVIPYVLINEPV